MSSASVPRLVAPGCVFWSSRLGPVGLPGLEVSAEFFEQRGQVEAACLRQVAERKFVIDLTELVTGDPRVVGVQGFLDLATVQVVTDPVLRAAFVQASHDSLLFSGAHAAMHRV